MLPPDLQERLAGDGGGGGRAASAGGGDKLRDNNRVGGQKVDRVECALSPQGGGART